MDDTPPEGGGGGMTPRAFAVGYKPHAGDLMVYGGGALTLVGVLATVVNGTPAFLLASIVGSLSAFYFHPTIDLATPQLGADTHGIFVARVGLVPWAEVAEIRVERRALRTMRLATLILRTRRPLSEAVAKPERVSLLARLTARNAKASGDHVRVPLHTLAVSPEAIETRLRALYAASRLGGA